MTVTVTKSGFNLRDTLNSLKQKIGLKGAELVKADTIADAYGALNPTMYRNRFMNGDFSVNQRGVTSYTQNGNTSTGSGTYTGSFPGDRWRCQPDLSQYNVTPAVITVARTNNSASIGFPVCVSITVTTAGVGTSAGGGTRDLPFLNQSIETSMLTDARWGTQYAKPLTLSFWIRSNVTGQRSMFIHNPAQSRSYIKAYNINNPNVWEYKTIYIPADNSYGFSTDLSSEGLRVEFRTSCAGTRLGTETGGWIPLPLNRAVTGDVDFYGIVGATLDITGIQLEVGSVATPFEFRPYDVEEAMCKRYYQQTWDGAGQPSGFNGMFSTTGLQGTGLTTGTINGTFVYPVRMRASPGVWSWDHLGNVGKVSSFNPNSNNYANETGGPTQINSRCLLLNRSSGSSASQIAAFMALAAELN